MFDLLHSLSHFSHLVRNPFLPKASNQHIHMLQFGPCQRHTKRSLKLLTFKFGTPMNWVSPTADPATEHTQDWPYLMLPETPGWQCQHRGRLRKRSRTTQLPSRELHPWHLCSLHAWGRAAAQGRGLCHDHQNKRVFPMPGSGHRLSTDHRKYDPSQLKHLNMHNCQTAFRKGFLFLFILTSKFFNFFKQPH